MNTKNIAIAIVAMGMQLSVGLGLCLSPALADANSVAANKAAIAQSSSKTKVGDFTRKQLLLELSKSNIIIDEKFRAELDKLFVTRWTVSLYRKAACDKKTARTMRGCHPVIICCDSDGNPYVIIICD